MVLAQDMIIKFDSSSALYTVCIYIECKSILLVNKMAVDDERKLCAAKQIDGCRHKHDIVYGSSYFLEPNEYKQK